MGESTAIRTRLDSLSGLRFVAALLVFGHHIGSQGTLVTSAPFLNPGAVGVSFFFVLSGFLLTWTAREGDSKNLFWRRRFARVYPAYAVAWIVVATYKLVFENGLHGTDLFALSLMQDWIPQERFYFGATAVFWSLSCEAFFYFVFPFLLPLLARLSARQRLVMVGGIAVVVLVIAFIVNPMMRGTVGNWFLYIFPPVRALEFVVGILFALHLRAGKAPHVPLPAALVLFAVAYAVASFVPSSFVPVSITLIPIALVILAAAQADIGEHWSPFRGRVIVELGVWSYSFYLLHTTVIALWFLAASSWWGVERETLAGVPLLLNVLACLVLAVLASALLHRLVEAPAEKLLRPARRTNELVASSPK